jgi:streptogramin lyase
MDGTVSTVYTGPDPDSVVVDSSDSLFVHDATTGMIYGFDSQGTQTTFVGPQTVLQNSGVMAPSPYGGLYFADYVDGTIVKYDPHGVATMVAAPGKLDHPVGLAYLFGEVLVAEAGTKNDVAAVFPDGTVGLFSSSLSPNLIAPSGLTVGPDQKLFVVDGGANGVNWYSTGRANTGGLLAGGVGGFADGNGAAAKFQGPRSIVADRQGNLYVADTGNHVVRKITPVAPQ